MTYQCTAPIRGHKYQHTRARCPACGTGIQLGTAGTQPAELTDFGTQMTGQHPNPEGLPASEKKPPNYDKVQQILTETALRYAADGAVMTALSLCADQLRREAQERGVRGHELCCAFAKAAEATDLSLLTNFVGQQTADWLVRTGVPRWAATIAAHGITTGASEVASILPGHEYAVVLRLLGILMCPDLDRCPCDAVLAERLVIDLIEEGAASPSDEIKVQER